ncbi:MAG TPA: adenylate/guanylate cyclase domain-containing protein [Actinomycetota bacterium]|nr:adenylate/guanylate cyclase domain-containing protein [Actinomycetota bacterium]
MATLTCERCGLPLPGEARFCPNCGYPVGAQLAEERKVVTVIFIDLVGSTKLSAQIDPERYREVLTRYYRRVTDELETLRGRAYNFAGDAVVGVFGLLHTHDDDALRAVRAGLTLIDRVGRLGQEIGLPVRLQVRVGIHTGPVAIGSEASEQGLIFGATVNLAARLQQAAEPGTVLVSETSFLLSQSQVEYGPMQKVEARGFESEAQAWPVVGLQPGSSRRTIAFIDRRHELRLLQDAFESARDGRHGHLVTLLGKVGIGKSRLAEEFMSGLSDDAKVLFGRASPFEEDSTFAPLVQILYREIGERADAEPARIRSRLEALIADCCPAEETPQVAARLGLLLGLGREPHDDERRFRAAEIRSGLRSLLEGMGRAGSVVLVLEDLHAAQPAMLELVEQVVLDAKDIPLLVLCVARYDLLDARPGWGSGRGNTLNLHLESMSLDDATQLAREAGEGLDPQTAERIARHADGNPFFIVETTGMLLHTGAAIPTGTGPLPDALVPPTVQAVVAARIDHLAPDARDLVRRASVFARSSFSLEELRLIAGPTDEVLDELEHEEVLERDEDRPDVWRFQHRLVRDVAYESLPKRERRRLHETLADGLAADPKRAARYPRRIASHLERAALSALDLDPSDREIADRAVAALSRAGGAALEGPDIRAAEDVYERALDLTGPDRGWGLREARIMAGLGEARYWLGEFERAVPALERALSLGGDDAAIRAQAGRFLGDIELSIRGNEERAQDLLQDALKAAREVGDPVTVARTLLVAAWGPYWRGDTDDARAMFEEALDTARANPTSDPWAEARALVGLAMLVEEYGDGLEAFGVASEALAIAEAARDRFSICVAREAVGGTLRRMMRLEEAERHLDGSVDGFRELGARWELASALTSRGIARRLAGKDESAVADLREAFKLCRELKERSIITWTAAALARSLIVGGDTSGARRVLAEAAQVANTGGPAPEEWLDHAGVELLLAEGERDGALEKALGILAFERKDGTDKDVAARVWWIAQIFGPDAAGGREEVERARDLLERTHSVQALREPTLVPHTGSLAERAEP